MRVIEELFDRWSFDGIELDWLRHTLYFPRGTERENGHFLTEFMRSVRRSLERREARRGKPIEIAVRIPERIEWCQAGGFEIDKWIDEDLVDILILGQGLTELPTINEFRSLMKDRQLPLYPCLTPYGNGYRISPEEVIRGSAANLWQNGADGLYTFNWGFFGGWRKELLRQIVDPRRLETLDRRFTVVQRVVPPARGPGADYVRFNVQRQAPPLPISWDVKDGPQEILVGAGSEAVAKDQRPKQVSLWLAFDFLGEDDVLDIRLNGHPLGLVSLSEKAIQHTDSIPLVIPENNGLLGLPLEGTIDVGFDRFAIDVPGDIVRARNNLTLTLKKRARGLDRPLRLKRVELDVREDL